MAEKQVATTTVVMMTKKEALETRDKINNHVGSLAALAKDFYHREGWKALGYKNWKDCAAKEFSHGRSRVYQLLDEAKVEQELGPDRPALSGRATAALKDAPLGKRKAALKAAQREHKTATPTGAQVKKTVKSKWARSGVTRSKKPEPIVEQAKDDESLQKALAILGGTCGRGFRQAIEEGTIELSRSDIIHLSEQDDETMMQAEKLISVNRWTLKRALSFLNDMPTLQHKLEQLTWHAVASPEDKWEGTFGAFTIVITVNRKKL